MEWVKNNYSVLILGFLFLIYTVFNESKEKPMPRYIIERGNVINIDSIQSVIQRQNRLMIDSAINKERRSIDSLKAIVRKDLTKYRTIEKKITDINSIIGELPLL